MIRAGVVPWKLSLHGSGVWTSAFTTDSGVRPIEFGDNRRTHRWQRPDPYEPGWVLGPAVSVPVVDDKHDLPASAGVFDYDSVMWVPTPSIGNTVEVIILIAEDPISEPEDLGDNETVLGGLSLQDEEMVWIVVRERPIEEAERRLILHTRDTEVGIGGIKGPEAVRRGEQSGSVLRVMTSNLGTPYIWQIACGSANYEAPFVDP